MVQNEIQSVFRVDLVYFYFCSQKNSIFLWFLSSIRQSSCQLSWQLQTHHKTKKWTIELELKYLKDKSLDNYAEKLGIDNLDRFVQIEEDVQDMGLTKYHLKD